MVDDDYEEMSPEDRADLRALRVDRTPSPELEGRVLDALSARGLLAADATAVMPVPWGRRVAIAAMLALVAGAGYFAGRLTPGDDPLLMGPPTERTFALLVYETPEMWPLPDTRQAYDETSRWIAGMRADGFYEGGARLEDDAAQVTIEGGTPVPVAGVPADATRVLSGFLLITAADRSAAERIAAESPLIRYGSTIEVREVLPD